MLSTHNLLTIDNLSTGDIDAILSTATSFEEINNRAIKKLPTLRGRTIVNLFLEPSTRTRTSFEIAAKRLGADAINMTGSASSTVKGESLQDTAQTLNAMSCDLVVVRHKYAGAPHILSQNMESHIVNGGDGIHQHPTQTLLDLYTLKNELGDIKGKTIGIVGDIVHSRVAGSLAPALKKLGAEVIFVAPPTFLPSRPDLLGARVCNSLDECIADLDVLYLLRIQKERADGSGIPSGREYASRYGLDARRAALLSEHAIIMHPGPMNRGVEIAGDVVSDSRVKVLNQVSAGVAVRMALMYLMLGGEDSGITA